MDQQYIIAYADKSVLKISGLQVKGLNTQSLEELLSEKLRTFVRIIGVTGEEIEMDVYGIDPELVRRDADGLIDAVALAEGVTLTELVKLSCSDKIVEVSYEEIPENPLSACAREKWMKRP